MPVTKLGAGQGRHACYDAGGGARATHLLQSWGQGKEDKPVTKVGAGRGPRTCYKGGADTGRGTCTAFLRMTQSSPLGERALGNHNLKSQGVLAFLVASLSSNLRFYNLKPFMQP